jgi:hypothetical protein
MELKLLLRLCLIIALITQPVAGDWLVQRCAAARHSAAAADVANLETCCRTSCCEEPIEKAPPAREARGSCGTGTLPCGGLSRCCNTCRQAPIEHRGVTAAGDRGEGRERDEVGEEAEGLGTL